MSRDYTDNFEAVDFKLNLTILMMLLTGFEDTGFEDTLSIQLLLNAENVRLLFWKFKVVLGYL